MSLIKSSQQDIIVIKSLTKTFSSEIFKLKELNEKDPKWKSIQSILYNLKDLFDHSSIDYVMSGAKTFELLENRAFNNITISQESKDLIKECIYTISSLNNKKFKTADDATKISCANSYREHLKLVFTGGSFAYQNKVNPKNFLAKITIETKNDKKEVLNQQEITPLKDGISTTSSKYTFKKDGEFSNIYVNATNDYMGVFSFPNELNIDLKVIDGVVHIAAGKVVLSDCVTIVEASSPTPPSTPSAPVIEQQKPDPVATQPTPPADPAPAEEADDDEQESKDGENN